MGSRRVDTCRVRYRLIGVLIGMAGLATSPALGQGAAASIVGQVTDQSGAVLPGVVVTTTSPALQVPQMTYVTNELGEYRLAPLPIGTYELAFELTGFRTVRRQDVRLTVGFTAKIDVVLNLGTVDETINVSGAPPVVDVTATAPKTLLTQEQLQLTPTGRSGLITLMGLAPGVHSILEVGGNNINANPSARVFGQGGEPWFEIEGVATATLGGSGSGNFYDYQTIEEAQVETLGTNADAATRGVQVHAIVKSGGNDFHGSGTITHTGQSFQSNNVDAALTALNISSGNALVNQYDQGGDLGGHIIRNKLWFYGAARRLGYDRTVLNAFQHGPDATEGPLASSPPPKLSGGSPDLETLKEQLLTAKLSLQATPSNRFVGYFGLLRKNEDQDATELVAWETRAQPYTRSTYPKVEWQGIRGNSLVASLQIGYRKWWVNKDLGTSGAVPGTTLVPRSDIGTQQVWGEATNSGQVYGEYRFDTKGAVTWYRPDWFHGNHKIKAGFDYIPDTSTRSTIQRNPDYALVYNNGAPFELVAISAPVVPPVQLHYLALYGEDSWTIGRRLTLDAGLRFSYDNAFVPAQCRVASDPPSQFAFPDKCFPFVQLPIWRSLAPRLHLAYDLSGDGKTVIKGGWGRYDHIRLLPDLLRVNQNSIATAVYRWHDLNGNNNYDLGEVNLDPNLSDFVTYTGPPSTSPTAGSTTANPPNSLVNPDLKQPISDEFSISFEREVISRLAVRVTGVYSRYINIYRLENISRPYSAYNVPITKPDPLTGQPITYYEYSPALAGAQFSAQMPITDPNLAQSYRSVEVAAFKRLANRWQFTASFSATKINNPVILGLAPAEFGTSVQAADFTPNDEINTAQHTWDANGKLSGAYTFPFGVLVSANFEHRLGEPFARQAIFTGGKTIPSITLNMEPIGAERLPSINILGVRVQKSFPVHLLKADRVALRLDVYNALNANTTTAENRRSGASFLRPQAILPPRIAEIGVAYTF